MYEIYVETCGQNTENQVNPATFGKMAFLADEYCNYCRDILRNVRN
uniref:Isoform 2 of DNA-binding protein RFX8 n=1 Tax=Homo sapiens TaxID=9606 RepID=Q6ZV50-2